MDERTEKAGFICVKDTLDGAYPSLVLGINAARQGMESKMTVDMMEIKEDKLIEGVVVWTAEDFLKYAKECKICLFT